MQGKVKGGKQKRRHESSGVFRRGYGTELCSRSFLFPKRRISVSGSARYRGSSWSAGWRRQQNVKRWLACRDAADMGQVVFAAWASAKRARTAFQIGAWCADRSSRAAMNAGKSCRGQSHAASDCRRRRYRATCGRSRKRRRATTRTVLQKPDASTPELGLQVYPAAPALKQAEAPQLAASLVPARRRSCVQPACLSQWKVRIPATNQQ